MTLQQKWDHLLAQLDEVLAQQDAWRSRHVTGFVAEPDRPDSARVEERPS